MELRLIMINNLELFHCGYFQINRDRIIQLLISEIIFLGKCYQKSKSPIEKKAIKNAGKKLQKLLLKQQNHKNDELLNSEYQALIGLIYKVIEKVSRKI